MFFCQYSNGFIFLNLLLFGKPPDFQENCRFFFFFLSMPNQCTGIPALKITLAHKCIISDGIWHKSIFSLVRSSPGGSYMSDQVKIILEHCAMSFSGPMPFVLPNFTCHTYKLLVLFFAKRQATGNKLHGSQLLISLTSRVRGLLRTRVTA